MGANSGYNAAGAAAKDALLAAQKAKETAYYVSYPAARELNLASKQGTTQEFENNLWVIAD